MTDALTLEELPADVLEAIKALHPRQRQALIDADKEARSRGLEGFGLHTSWVEWADAIMWLEANFPVSECRRLDKLARKLTCR